MPKNYYTIAGTRIIIEHGEDIDIEKFELFRSEPFEDPDVCIRAEKGIPSGEGNDLIYKEDRGLLWYRREDGKGRFEFFESGTMAIKCACDFTPDWKFATIYYRDAEELSSYLAGPAGEIIFRNALIRRGGMVIHAAAVEHEGGAVAFSAPSETGKTTQANLWKEHLGASDLNGDRPAFIFSDGRLMCCGTAWSGSSEIYLNRIIPLKALVFIERAAVNEAFKLTPGKAAGYMLPRSFLPYFDTALMHTAMDVVDRIVSSGRIYLLRCRPDREAVEVLSKCLAKG